MLQILLSGEDWRQLPLYIVIIWADDDVTNPALCMVNTGDSSTLVLLWADVDVKYPALWSRLVISAAHSSKMFLQLLAPSRNLNHIKQFCWIKNSQTDFEK